MSIERLIEQNKLTIAAAILAIIALATILLTPTKRSIYSNEITVDSPETFRRMNDE